MNVKKIKNITIHTHLEYQNQDSLRYVIEASGKYLSGSRFKNVRIDISKSEYRHLRLKLLLNEN